VAHWGLEMNTARVLPRPGFHFRTRWIGDALAHTYIWIWLGIFALPFVATLLHSLELPKGGYGFAGYDQALGSFKSNLMTSFKVTGLTIAINLAIGIPAAYAFVRHKIPGKDFLLSILNLSLYTPAAVMGLSLLITYAFLFHIPKSTTGLVAAYVVGTYPLMLVPMIVALRDLPTVYEEAARTLGANRFQSLVRIELPLLGPGISAGVLLTFVIVFNEFLVTLFIAGPNTTTAALRVYNLTRTAGFMSSTAALASIMQLVSFLVVLAFFKFFGSRYLKGTYLI
jgi:ABC-type spermidine/putrescine transport system permease subunit II